MRGHVPVIALALLATASACARTTAATSSPSRFTLRCAGVSARVPKGWHGRVRVGTGGLVTLTLASFPLVSEADAVDEQSAKRMSRQDVLILLIGYGPNQAAPAFASHVRLPLAVERMTVYRVFEHLPPGHRLARALFVGRDGAYDAQIQFAQPLTRLLRSKADSALRLLRFERSPQQLPNARTRC